MRVSYQWLSELVADLPPLDDVVRCLTMGGLEVESVEKPKLAYGEALVVARIARMEPHPNADRLTLCHVDDGGPLRQVVCGARNMQEGDTVVLARPGCELPGGLRIKAARLRGVESQGMLCSASELGLEQESQGILILENGLTAGIPAARLLGLDDVILEVAITPNRGDCLSMRGIAREVSALCGASLRPMAAAPAVRLGEGAVPVCIEVRDRCSLYRGGVLRGVRVAASPTWLRTRLAAAGLRSINNVVDVTNFVLLELGQPLHAFDLPLLDGPEIRVRLGRPGERLRTLDDRDLELDGDDLVIADARRPVALAGVMGGAETAVSNGTHEILLEAAVFDPAGVRRTSRRHSIATDSSYRFERGIDATSVDSALARAMALLQELALASRDEAVCADGASPTEVRRITLRPARVQQVLGVAVETSQIGDILSALGCEVAARQEDGALAVGVPGHRIDLEREIDLIEEVARVRGYDAIPAVLPHMPMMRVRISRHERAQRDLRALLTACGVSEHLAMTFATAHDNRRFPGLHEGEPVRLLNPVRAGEDELRRSVLGSLTAAVRVNAAAAQPRIDLFTIGSTFFRGSGGQVEQRQSLGIVLCGARPGRGPGRNEPLSFGDLKAITERVLTLLAPGLAARFVATSARAEYHPRSCAAVQVGEAVLAHLGKLHPDIAEQLEITEEIFLAEIDYPRVVEYSPRHPGLRPIPRYPSSTRDVSLLVARTMPAGAAIEAVERLEDPCIESIVVFDEYSGAGIGQDEKALGYTIVYRAADRTLTDAEVTALHEKVSNVLIEQLRARVRT
ncbi:MAG TPA: phenylalanine--tRNA ligase subunit beta [Candidatus Limnocylindrales bacterium]|nr:phenylalanine--tRNA ligase subunit beta [Candidatus Limnocylindrales bacterium]